LYGVGGGVKGGIKAGLQDPQTVTAWLQLLESYGMSIDESTLAIMIENMEVRPSALKFAAEPPETLADRLEVAGRAGMNFGMWDLYISGFRGWEDAPVLWVESELVLPQFQVAVDPKALYRKATALGVAASGTYGPYTFWGEGSYTWPDKVKELDIEDNIALSTNDPYFQAVLGADRMFGDASEYYVMGQYIYNSSGSLLLPYRMPVKKLRQAIIWLQSPCYDT